MTELDRDASPYRTVPLDTTTWPAFDDLLAAHNGVFGGCWCLDFHGEGSDKSLGSQQRRTIKHELVKGGRAHAALVMAGDECVGWCQYGPPAELPRIKLRRTYEAQIASGAEGLPDWRITCFFVGRGHRRSGVAGTALAGALAQIAGAGGGLVEAYPDNIEGRKVSSSFLWAGTIPMFEAAGFERGRQLGKNTWVMSRTVQPQTAR